MVSIFGPRLMASASASGISLEMWRIAMSLRNKLTPQISDDDAAKMRSVLDDA